MLGACSFEADPMGFDKFEQYLASSAKTPVGLLLDIIEEDFRQDSVPHVMGSDRKAVVARLIDRHYRASKQYTYSVIQGQQKAGRKDDEVLLAAITNPDIVSQWLRIIEHCNVPLAGIWSLPLLSKSMLSVISANKGPVLLVSQQVNSILRQTFFRNGKMMSSRQSVVNQGAENINDIGKLALPEVEKTLQFIRNQQQIEDSEIINVHLLGSDAQRDSLITHFVSGRSSHYHVHRLTDINQRIGLDGLSDRFADGLFSWVAANKFGSASHYGGKNEFQRFYHALASRALYAASVAVVIIGLLLTEANISEGISFEKSTSLLTKRTDEYILVYKDKYQKHEGLFSNAGLMDMAVNLVDQVERNRQVSPLDFMAVLSRLIGHEQLKEVRIDKIEWTTRQRNDPNSSRARRKSAEKPSYATTDPTSSNEVQHVALVRGRIPTDPRRYRDSVGQIDTLISLLRSSERIAEVSAIDLPVEVRSEKKFASDVGTLARQSNEDKKRDYGFFSLQIIMKGPEHV